MLLGIGGEGGWCVVSRKTKDIFPSLDSKFVRKCYAAQVGYYVRSLHHILYICILCFKYVWYFWADLYRDVHIAGEVETQEFRVHKVVVRPLLAGLLDPGTWAEADSVILAGVSPAQLGHQLRARYGLDTAASATPVQVSASKRSIRRFVITEKAPTRAFSWLKAATTAFTFKTLLRHYANRALTPRSLNVKLGLRRKSHKVQAVWLA